MIFLFIPNEKKYIKKTLKIMSHQKKNFLQNIYDKILYNLEKLKLASFGYRYNSSIKLKKKLFFILCFAKFIKYLITNKVLVNFYNITYWKQYSRIHNYCIISSSK